MTLLRDQNPLLAQAFQLQEHTQQYYLYSQEERGATSSRQVNYQSLMSPVFFD